MAAGENDVVALAELARQVRSGGTPRVIEGRGGFDKNHALRKAGLCKCWHVEFEN